MTNDKYQTEAVWKEKTQAIQGQIIEPELNILLSREIQMIDSLIIINAANTEPLYHIYRLTKNNQLEQLSTFGTMGEGPNEFIFNTAMNIGENKISIFDKSLLRNYIIDLYSLSNNTKIQMKTEYLNNSSSFNKLIAIEDNIYFGNGTFERGMFAFYHHDSLIYTDVPYPEDGIDASNEQKGMVYQGCLVKQLRGNRFVYGGYYGHILEIFSIDGFSLKRIFSDIYEFPQYGMKQSGTFLEANYKNNNRTGFFSISTTQEYIYALYSGKKRGDDRIDYANIVYIYDWDGNRIKKCIMDKDVSGICVDKNNKKIYGLYTDPNDDNLKIVCYSLKL
jgi:hypothetical protein